MLGVRMTTFYDIPADLLIPALADHLSETKGMEAPEWSSFVKTAHLERPPTQSNWWFLRAASIFAKSLEKGRLVLLN